MEHHHAVVDDRIMVVGHAVALRHRIGFVRSGPQFPADDDFVLISIRRPVLAHDIFVQRLAVLVGDDRASGDGGAGDGARDSAGNRIALRQRSILCHRSADDQCRGNNSSQHGKLPDSQDRTLTRINDRSIMHSGSARRNACLIDALIDPLVRRRFGASRRKSLLTQPAHHRLQQLRRQVDRELGEGEIQPGRPRQ